MAEPMTAERMASMIGAEVARFVGAESDGNGDRARTDGERQRQRVESVAERLGAALVAADGAALVLIFLQQHSPARRNHQQPAADLHYRKRNSEKREHVCSDCK